MRAAESRGAFPSDAYSILYRITPARLTSAPTAELAPPGHPARVLPSAPRRPGDSYSRVDASLAVRRQLAIASADASLPLDVGATLISEAALLLERLGHHRLTRSRELLDQAARSSRVTRALSASSADYLRALGCRSWRRQVGELDLPVRVARRLGERIDQHLGRCDLIESAIRWETAALLCERTMGDWGSDVVLGGFR